MLGNRPPYRPQQGVRPPIGYGRPISRADWVWQSVWPYRISLILGSLIILLSVTIFALEIALLGVIGMYNTATTSDITSCFRTQFSCIIRFSCWKIVWCLRIRSGNLEWNFHRYCWYFHSYP